MSTAVRRVFISRYRSGLMFTPGPGWLIAPLLIIPGVALFKTIIVAVLFATFSFMLGLAVWTRTRQRQAALALTPEGMRLDAMPFQAWSQIQGIRPLTDEKDRPVLEIRLKRVILPSEQRTPLWRPSGDHTILLDTSLLQDSAAEIEDAFEWFLTQPAH
jgi:hypothetical protein